MYILRHRILVAALASLASRCNQASLRLAKGWIAFTNGIFDSWEPPIYVPVPAHPQVGVLVDPPPAAGGPLAAGGPTVSGGPPDPTGRQHKPPGKPGWYPKPDIPCSYIVNSGEYIYTNFSIYEIQDIGYMESRGHLICKDCTYSCCKMF